MLSNRNRFAVAHWLLVGAALAVGCGDDGGSNDPVDTDEDAGSTDDTDDAVATDDTDDTDDPVATDDTDDTDDPDDTDDTDDTVTTDDAGSGESDAGATDDTTDDATDDPSDDDTADAGTDDATDDMTDDGVTDEPTTDDAGTDADAGDPEPPEPVFETIADLGGNVLPQVNDLRGLTFAASGKIYASGHVGASNDAERSIAVMRFNADGTPDSTFGTAGLVTHNLVARTLDGETVTNSGDEQSLGIVELSSGELLLSANVKDAAGLGTDVVLVKFDSAGELVPSFGNGGVLRVDFGWTPADDASWPIAGAAPVDNAWDLRLDKSGDVEKVVVFAHGPATVGAMDTSDPPVQRTDNDRYIVRLLASDGSIDPSFNQGVAYTLHTGGTFSDGGRRGEVLADGSILSAGYTNFGAGLGNHVLNIRLLPSGLPDPSFGFGIGIPGVVRTNPFIDDGGIAECYAFAMQSTGRYVTTGYGRATAAGQTSRLGWVTTDGVDLVSVGHGPRGNDLSYGSGATVAIQSEEFALGATEDRGRDLVVLPDDRVVHVGRFGVGPAIFVTLPDGQMDLDSGVDGRFEYTALTDPTSHFFKVALSADGKTIDATTNNHADGVLLAMLKVGEE